jgi:hypothetical protein
VLARLSLFYLALPAFVFLTGWARPILAVPVAVTLVLGLVWSVRSMPAAAARPLALLDRGILAVVVVVLALLSGAGAVGHQRVDWLKHNALLHDLVVRAWPVVYPGDGTVTGLLSYGLGYYLPAAVVGRVAGLNAAHVALLVWTALGLGLTVAWVVRLSVRPTWLAVAGWLAFSGMDVLGLALLRGTTRDSMAWWAGFAQYSSNPGLLFWVPQHALAGWLGAAVLMDAHEERRPAVVVAIVLVLATLWSPLSALGLVPLAVASLVRQRPSLREGLRAAVALPLGALLAAYLLGMPRSGIPVSSVWGELGPIRGTAMWALFVALEVGAPLAVLVLLRSRMGPSAFWLVPVGLTLVLLPLIHVGLFNDLVMRASIPALFVLALLLLRVRWEGPEGAARTAPITAQMLALALLVGAIQPALELANQVIWSRGAETAPEPPVEVSLSDLPAAMAEQYVSPFDGLYARWIAPVD